MSELTDEQRSDRFDRYGALYMLCNRWHSGQWSRGYRIGSRIKARGYRPGMTVAGCKSFESDAMRVYYRRYGKLRHSL